MQPSFVERSCDYDIWPITVLYFSDLLQTYFLYYYFFITGVHFFFRGVRKCAHNAVWSPHPQIWDKFLCNFTNRIHWRNMKGVYIFAYCNIPQKHYLNQFRICPTATPMTHHILNVSTKTDIPNYLYYVILTVVASSTGSRTL